MEGQGAVCSLCVLCITHTSAASDWAIGASPGELCWNVADNLTCQSNHSTGWYCTGAGAGDLNSMHQL